VVIEEDGKTEEEFISSILSSNDEIATLVSDARKLEKVIMQNVRSLTGEE